MSGRTRTYVVTFEAADPPAVEVLGGFDESIGVPDFANLVDEDSDVGALPLGDHVTMALGAMVDGLADTRGRRLILKSVEPA